jgi:hypothetical protein
MMIENATSRVRKVALVLLATGLLSAAPFGNSAAYADSLEGDNNPIVVENANPGTQNWRLGWTGKTGSTDAGGQILGYASAPSVNLGGVINLHVSTTPAAPYTIDIYRLGSYADTGGRLMTSVGPLNGTSQPACPLDAPTGLLECNWAVGHALTVPLTWTSGIYLAMLSTASHQASIPFVVRDDSRLADFVYVMPFMTYHAYNAYPNTATTGKSFFDYSSKGANTVVGSTRAVKLSLSRPVRVTFFEDENDWEGPLFRWLEKSGYNVKYVTDHDLHTATVDQYALTRGVLIAGHNQFWTSQMFTLAEQMRDRGVNLAFFGADSVNDQIRLEPSTTNTPNRTMVFYDAPSIDPVTDPLLKTGDFRRVGRPEQTLIGVQYANYNDAANPQRPLVIQNASAWVYSGTGFITGTQVPGLVGFSVDFLHAEFTKPVSTSYTILASSPFTGVDPITVTINAVSSIYQAPSGAYVFASGTLGWSWGLGRTGFVNPGMQRTAQNLLNRYRQRAGVKTVTLPFVSR